MESGYDLFFKAATVGFGLFSAGKTYFELSTGRRSKLREEYKFAKEFLDNVDDEMHPFLKEKGYQAIAGDSTISGAEVEYLLSLTRSDRALAEYVMGRKYLEHLPASGNLQITFKRRYATQWSRQWLIRMYVALYCVFALAVFSPWMLSSYLRLSAQDTSIAFFAGLVVFPYGLLFLRSATKIQQAQKLVANQDRHTQRVLVPALSRRRKAGE